MISHAGEVPKRLKGLVSKTDSGRKSSEGSNPSFSANKQKWGTRENACPFSFSCFRFYDGVMKKTYLLSIGLTQEEIDQVQTKQTIRMKKGAANRGSFSNVLTNLRSYNQVLLQGYGASPLGPY